MKHAPLFVLLTGPSGSGKSTILEALLKKHAGKLHRFITMTTRAPRPGEKHGVDYWFTDRTTFEDEIEAHAFFEYADVYGQYYGSHKDELERLQKAGKPMIMIIDVKGSRAIKQALPEAFTVYVDAPHEQLVRRLRERNLPPMELDRRLAEMERESVFKQEADLVVLNEDGEFERALKMVEQAIKERT